MKRLIELESVLKKTLEAKLAYTGDRNMAKTYTEEEFDQEMLRALAENRKPRFKGQDALEEKRKRKGVITKLPVRYD